MSKEIKPITPVGRMRYQWQRNGEDIIGEHKSFYLVTAADIGTKLSRRADYMSERRDKFDKEFRDNEQD